MDDRSGSTGTQHYRTIPVEIAARDRDGDYPGIGPGLRGDSGNGGGHGVWGGSNRGYSCHNQQQEEEGQTDKEREPFHVSTSLLIV